MSKTRTEANLDKVRLYIVRCVTRDILLIEIFKGLPDALNIEAAYLSGCTRPLRQSCILQSKTTLRGRLLRSWTLFKVIYAFGKLINAVPRYRNSMFG